MSSIADQFKNRCEELELSLTRAQQLALEMSASGSRALAEVLGLDADTLQPLKPRRWLWMAAQSASVSYRSEFTDKQLLTALRTGKVQQEYVAHISTLLDESPIPIVVMALLQASQSSGIPMTVMWKNVEQLSWQVKSHRHAIWNAGQ